MPTFLTFLDPTGQKAISTASPASNTVLTALKYERHPFLDNTRTSLSYCPTREGRVVIIGCATQESKQLIQLSIRERFLRQESEEAHWE
jgi:hypothetical protein